MSIANSELITEIRIMSTKLEEVIETLNNLEKKIDNKVLDINNQIAAIHTQHTNSMLELDHELWLLNEKIDDIKFANNNTNKALELTISGLPEMDSDELQSTVSKICSLISFNDAKTIVGIHRLLHTHQSTHGPVSSVIICFATTNSRRLFLSKYFTFIKTDPLKLSHIGIDSQNRLYINENLSKQCLEVLQKAKLLKRNGKIAGVQSYDGQIYVFHRENQQFEIVSSIGDLKKYE